MTTVRDLASGREVTLPGPVALPAAVPAAVDAPLATMERERRRETIRRTLAHHAGKNLDASAVAAATLSTWQEVATRLAPVIGAQGVDVLFRRALHLTHRSFPWLAITGGEVKDIAVLLASLKEHLAACEPAVAVAASDTLLVTFTELLTIIIGEPLTARLLDSVWVPTAPASQLETET